MRRTKAESSVNEGALLRVRWLASLAATATCAYLSLASSPACFEEFGVFAEKPLRFEPGQKELTLRVTVEGANVRLTFHDPFDLSSPGFTTERFTTEPTESDGGAPFSELADGANIDASADVAAGAEVRGGTPGTLCGPVETSPRSEPPNEPPEGTLVPRDTVCEFHVIRRDASDALDSKITASALSDCGEFPEYGIDIEIVE